MNNLIRLLIRVLPIFIGMLIALCVMALLASIKPLLIPAAIFGTIVLVAWVGLKGRR